mmetsp:Transcript_30531/g.79171  ORF Transcript_30531/g.79171 Transcript_30531/m.79171 type:complete len:143 (+) Transcript_30531:2686-3114(+)
MVPDAQNAPKVLVNAVRIASMVHSVLRGGIYHFLQDPEFGDHLGMQPKLSDGIQHRVPLKDGNGNKRRQTQVEQNASKRLQNALAKRREQMVVFRRVVYRVGCPQKIDAVGASMGPVEPKVYDQKYKGVLKITRGRGWGRFF